MEARSRLETVHAGHLYVKERNVGNRVERYSHDLVAARALRNDVHVALEREQGGECPADHPLVFRDENADHAAA
jgi:hypothetical protein